MSAEYRAGLKIGHRAREVGVAIAPIGNGWGSDASEFGYFEDPDEVAGHYECCSRLSVGDL
jgi:hypothetical protein